MCRVSSPVLLINSYFKTFSQVELYLLECSVLIDLRNSYAISSSRFSASHLFSFISHRLYTFICAHYHCFFGSSHILVLLSWQGFNQMSTPSVIIHIFGIQDQILLLHCKCMSHNQLQYILSCVIAKYVLETNMPTKFGMDAIYTKCLMDSYGRFIHMYVPHMKSLQPNMQEGTLYIYVTYVTEQIWLPHCTYVSLHC